MVSGAEPETKRKGKGPWIKGLQEARIAIGGGGKDLGSESPKLHLLRPQKKK